MSKIYEASELGDMLIYQNEKGDTKIDVFFQENDVWMNQASIAKLYNTTPQNITIHIKKIYADGELEERATCKQYLQVQTEGTREIKRNKKYYNFRMILAIGYRVRSNVGTHFRNWVSGVLEEYTKKGFVMNDERLKNPKQFGVDYFDELLERIRDIRASEKRFYQKICEIYKTSIDYSSSDEEAKLFLKTVQNKIHYGVHGHAAAEVIMKRADATKDNMGLTTFEGAKVRKKDVDIAKNYLNEEEMSELNRVVTMYLDFAEDQARRHIPMYMKDWEEKLNNFLNMTGREVLSGAGHVSAEQAKKYAYKQYEIYNEQRIHIQEDDTIDELVQNAKDIKSGKK
ncbi:MAG: virulence RhuM family protein [Roseburia sp.]|nr:virulence RhuM family protein [Roseburia sp.]MCM1279375.1 virulence RhuM family protein [Robinsoniella sp.]